MIALNTLKNNVSVVHWEIIPFHRLIFFKNNIRPVLLALYLHYNMNCLSHLTKCTALDIQPNIQPAKRVTEKQSQIKHNKSPVSVFAYLLKAYLKTNPSHSHKWDPLKHGCTSTCVRLNWGLRWILFKAELEIEMWLGFSVLYSSLHPSLLFPAANTILFFFFSLPAKNNIFGVHKSLCSL